MSSMHLSGPISEIQPWDFPVAFMEVHDRSPVINGWWTCNSTHPHTHRPHQVWPTLHSCRKDTRWWTSSSIVTSSFSLPGCSHWHRLSTHSFFDPFTPIFGFPHLCWVKMQCWSGSAAAMLQTPWILWDKILCFLKVLISLVAHCNHLAHWGHGGIIPVSIPAWPSLATGSFPSALQNSASALRQLVGHTNNKTCTLVSSCFKVAGTLNYQFLRQHLMGEQMGMDQILHRSCS